MNDKGNKTYTFHKPHVKLNQSDSPRLQKIKPVQQLKIVEVATKTRIKELTTEQWLNNMLRKTKNFDKETPLESCGIERKEFLKTGMSNNEVDRIYRAIYVYSVGFHDCIREIMTQSNQSELVANVWNAYSSILENSKINNEASGRVLLEKQHQVDLQKIETTHNTALTRLHIEISNLGMVILEKDAEIQNLNGFVWKKDEQLSHAQNEIEKQKRGVSQVQFESKKLSDSIAVQKTLIKELSLEIQENRVEAAKLNQNFLVAQQVIADGHAVLDKMTQELCTAKDYAQRMKEETEKCKNLLQEEVIKCQKAEDMLSKQERTIATLGEEHKKSEKSNAENLIKINNDAKRFKKILLDRARCFRIIADLESKLKCAELEFDTETKGHKKDKKSLSNLQAMTIKLQEESKEMKTQQIKYREKIALLESLRVKDASMKEALKQDVGSSDSAIFQLESQLDNVIKDYTQECAIREKITGNLAESLMKVTQLEVTIKELQFQCEKKTAQLDQYRQEKTQQESKIKTKHIMHEEKEDTSRKVIVDLESKVKQLGRDTRDLKRERDILEARAIRAEKELELNNVRMEEVRHVMEASRELATKLKAELCELNAQVEHSNMETSKVQSLVDQALESMLKVTQKVFSEVGLSDANSNYPEDASEIVSNQLLHSGARRERRKSSVELLGASQAVRLQLSMISGVQKDILKLHEVLIKERAACFLLERSLRAEVKKNEEHMYRVEVEKEENSRMTQGQKTVVQNMEKTIRVQDINLEQLKRMDEEQLIVIEKLKSRNQIITKELQDVRHEMDEKTGMADEEVYITRHEWYCCKSKLEVCMEKLGSFDLEWSRAAISYDELVESMQSEIEQVVSLKKECAELETQLKLERKESGKRQDGVVAISKEGENEFVKDDASELIKDDESESKDESGAKEEDESEFEKDETQATSLSHPVSHRNLNQLRSMVSKRFENTE